MTLTAPKSVTDRITELHNLCDEYPLNIPVTRVAEFLHTHPDSLRRALEQNPRLFGFSWKQTLKGNRAFCIPAVTFWLWYTNGNSFDIEME